MVLRTLDTSARSAGGKPDDMPTREPLQPLPAAIPCRRFRDSAAGTLDIDQGAERLPG